MVQAAPGNSSVPPTGSLCPGCSQRLVAPLKGLCCALHCRSALPGQLKAGRCHLPMSSHLSLYPLYVKSPLVSLTYAFSPFLPPPFESPLSHSIYTSLTLPYLLPFHLYFPLILFFYSLTKGEMLPPYIPFLKLLLFLALTLPSFSFHFPCSFPFSLSTLDQEKFPLAAACLMPLHSCLLPSPVTLLSLFINVHSLN